MKYSIVPVVISVSEEYSKLAPRKSYIDGRDFTSAHELAEYLLHLQENAGIYIYIHPKLDLVTTRYSELHDLVNKPQLPSYFILYQYSI